MLYAKCDRCGEDIPEFEPKKHQMMIVNPHEDDVLMFDLCDECGPIIKDQLSDWIKGA